MATERQRLRPRLPVAPRVLPHIAGEERPCARRARSSRRGVHQAHSSVQATSHSSAAAAVAPARVHGEASRSVSRARVAIRFLQRQQSSS
ncbi:hypothetical protein SEVIR_5G241401v4 [Setaria viridis]